MKDLVKAVYEKKGKLLVPAFEHGRILICETAKEDLGNAELHLMQQPKDETRVIKRIASRGFQDGVLDMTLGSMVIETAKGSEAGTFDIAVDEEERSKGYGTVLMNAGAKYGQSIGIRNLNGSLIQDEELHRRKDFFKKMGLWSDGKDAYTLLSNPFLNSIEFKQNPAVEESLNSIKH